MRRLVPSVEWCDDYLGVNMLRFVLTVTSVTKLTDGLLLVQLQGPYGHASLNLPISQGSGLRVGQEFHVGAEGVSFPGAIDEVEERKKFEGRDTLSHPRTFTPI
jgi:hypothetical protein